jgi:nicotinamide phosphoribosyltransferase
MNNIILNTDAYKPSHYLQYPPRTQFVSSYIEARGGEYAETVFAGLQRELIEYLSQPITANDIREAASVLTGMGLPFNKEGWDHILKVHRGYLPLKIQAVPEGTVLPVGNVMVQVRNTDPVVPWLTSYIETSLLRAVWYPTTVATRSYECRKIIKSYLEKTADNIDSLPFKLHDFGARGVSSKESAGIGGLAHLLSFQGTDTIEAVLYANKYYYEPAAGFSIPAAEHSTITAWGVEFESSAYRNMINKFGNGMVAVVSDSYDISNACKNIWGKELKSLINGIKGTLVVRPDSGDPATIVLQTIRELMEAFGTRINSKGYSELPKNIRVIQGDGVSQEEIEKILKVLVKHAISTENIAFGMGGELLQKLNRDTCKFAMKASAICQNGEWHDVYKDPVTDTGKRSKRGVLKLVSDGKKWATCRDHEYPEYADQLRIVYEDGVLSHVETLSEIRKRLHG